MTYGKLIIVNPKENRHLGVITYHDGMSIGKDIETAIKTKQLNAFDIDEIAKLLQKGIKNSTHDAKGDFQVLGKDDADWSWVLSIGTRERATLTGFGYSEIYLKHLKI